MNSIALLSALCICSSYGAQLNSYLPPRGGAGSGAGLITGPSYSGGGFGAGRPGYAGSAFGAGGAAFGAGGGSYAGAPSGPVIPILSYENNPNQGDGTYSYRAKRFRDQSTPSSVPYKSGSLTLASLELVKLYLASPSGTSYYGREFINYQTGNGIAAQESGRVPGPESGTEAQGSYSYTGPDGQQYTVTYTAGANGFVAQGAHLPTPPPIPEAILQSLAFNAANPQSEFNTGGSGSYSGSYSGAPAFRPGTSYSPSTGYHYRK